MTQDKILKNIKILDMSEGVAGPYATTLLGDMGASVVKIERPEGEWGRGSLKSNFVAVNRNKRDLCLNLKNDKAKNIIRRLIIRSDVVVSNYRKGVMDRMGFGFQSCRELNPKIIYCTISAFGQKGAYSDRPASDTIIQALSGIMESIGETEGPPLRVSFPLIDLYAASLAAQGILLALYAREQGETGSWIDISLLNTAMVLQCQALAEFLNNGELPKRCGNQNPALSPAGAFQTRDGKFVSIAVLGEARWKRFCEVIESPEMIKDERFKDNDCRLIYRQILNRTLNPIFLTKSQEEWISILSREDILCAPINTLLNVFNDSKLHESLSLLEFDIMGQKVRIAGNPIEINGEYPSLEKPPCLKGEHSNEILKELDFGDDEIEAMICEGITHQR